LVDLAALTAADFRPLIGELFDVAGTASPVQLTLSAVDEGRRTFDHRRSFSLVFVGPTSPLLGQGIWRLEHEAFDGLEIFLVPLGPGAAGALYEAVFT
jgi:hypothetical protein